jgi:hypothetical protein
MTYLTCGTLLLATEDRLKHLQLHELGRGFQPLDENIVIQCLNFSLVNSEQRTQQLCDQTSDLQNCDLISEYCSQLLNL